MSEAQPPKTPADAPSPNRPWRNPWAIGFVVGALALTVLPFLQSLSYRAPPPLASLGEWSLVDQWGKPLGSEQLKGKVWIASFFFSRCPSICPKQQQDMGTMLRHVDDLGDKVHFVSITVDPEYDMPEVLNGYARKLKANQDVWHFVGGPKDKVRELLVDRMKVVMGERRAIEGQPNLFDISHQARFALIDQNGDLRGFWATDDEGRGNMINAARMLAKRGPNP